MPLLTLQLVLLSVGLLIVRSSGEISLPSGCRDDWQQALLQANTYRSLHSAGALLWDSELAISAQAVADLSAQSDCQLGTLAPGVSGFSNAGYKAQGNCVDAVKQWYSQNALYIWSDKPYTSNAPLVKVGDFTQLVWKSTSKVGCGSATTGTCVVVICQYSAPGNTPATDTDFALNVVKAPTAVTATMSTFNEQTLPDPNLDPSTVLSGQALTDASPPPRAPRFPPRSPPAAPSPPDLGNAQVVLPAGRRMLRG